MNSEKRIVWKRRNGPHIIEPTEQDAIRYEFGPEQAAYVDGVLKAVYYRIRNNQGPWRWIVEEHDAGALRPTDICEVQDRSWAACYATRAALDQGLPQMRNSGVSAAGFPFGAPLGMGTLAPSVESSTGPCPFPFQEFVDREDAEDTTD